MPFQFRRSFGGRGRSGGSWKVRLLIAAVIVGFSLFSYYTLSDKNPYTGESQRIGINAEQEVQFGLAAVPELTAQFGGESSDAQATAHVQQVGGQLVAALEDMHGIREHPYKFSFTLLADPETVNAFALPGGPMFITEALYRQLETEGQLAGVMGHELGLADHFRALGGRIVHEEVRGFDTGPEGVRHAITDRARHVCDTAVIAAGDTSGGHMAQMVGNFIQMSYGREDELECDGYGLELMARAGYDPRSMVGVMKILKAASASRAGGGGPREWASTHPDPGRRVEQIEETIGRMYPNGVPEGLKP